MIDTVLKYTVHQSLHSVSRPRAQTCEARACVLLSENLQNSRYLGARAGESGVFTERERALRQETHLQYIQISSTAITSFWHPLHPRPRCLMSLSASVPVASSAPLISSSAAWQQLQSHVHSPDIADTHLRTLLQDEQRCRQMTAEYDGILLDYSRQRATNQTINLLFGRRHT
jgi:hypothetical protein